MTDVAQFMQKNYQIWYHRRRLVELLIDPSRELSFINQMLHLDPKNYFAWSHRQWVISSWQELNQHHDSEFEYTAKLLEQDPQNNSAWSYRFFLTENFRRPLNLENGLREIQFVDSILKKFPENESAWNYLDGLYQLLNDETKSHYLERVQFIIQTELQTSSSNRFPLSLYVRFAERHQGTFRINQALEFCEELATRLDTTRQKYWRFKKRCLINLSSSN